MRFLRSLNGKGNDMTFSVAEVFLLAWAVCATGVAVHYRMELKRFVFMGGTALEKMHEVLEDIADGKATVSRTADGIKVRGIIE